ncbi:D-alanine--D-alanine ligase [Nonomuraea sp. NPDC049709]|uniref:D-alanine--D-alanine ligase family protein n=1 Tax=Nonomuraea sp. NPDC049709 TaxID=3154736 RepID=UPI003429FFEB
MTAQSHEVLSVAVLFGGSGSERGVSAASAWHVVGALRECGHRVHAVDLSQGRLSGADEERCLQAEIHNLPPTPELLASAAVSPRLAEQLMGVDVVFLALHGSTGENGGVQAVLESAGLPYTGGLHVATTVATDKDLSKRLLRAADIRTPDWNVIRNGDSLPPLDGPVVVQPNARGSVIGLTLVTNPHAFPDAVRQLQVHYADVIVERFVAGRDFAVGVLNGRSLAVGEIRLKNKKVFDYEAKYQLGDAVAVFPAEMPISLEAKLRALAVRAHRTLRLGSYSSAHFRVDQEGRIWCLEVDALPGLTPNSLFPQAAQAVGIPFPRLCEAICRLAVRP